MNLDQEIARVKALRAPLMQWRQSAFAGQLARQTREKLKVYDDAVREGENALAAGDDAAKAAALDVLRGVG